MIMFLLKKVFPREHARVPNKGPRRGRLYVAQNQHDYSLHGSPSMKRLLASLNEQRDPDDALRMSSSYRNCNGLSKHHRGFVFRCIPGDIARLLPEITIV